MVHGGMTLVKYLLFLFNFVFWLSGIAIIVAGTVIQIKYSQYINFLGNSFLSAPILLIVVGCVVAFLGFFGCCGAIRENYCMTMTFAVLLGVIFILELAAGIASYVLRYDVEDIVMKQTKDGMLNYNTTGSEGVSLTWDRMQRDFHCCGTEEYSDWGNNTIMFEKRSVPDSCCIASWAKPQCGASILDMGKAEAGSRVYTKGCAEELKDWVIRNVAIVGGTGVGVAFIQVRGSPWSSVRTSVWNEGRPNRRLRGSVDLRSMPTFDSGGRLHSGTGHTHPHCQISRSRTSVWNEGHPNRSLRGSVDLRSVPTCETD